jgi:hypothetical protein
MEPLKNFFNVICPASGQSSLVLSTQISQVVVFGFFPGRKEFLESEHVSYMFLIPYKTEPREENIQYLE